jgi:hypothetical protein
VTPLVRPTSRAAICLVLLLLAAAPPVPRPPSDLGAPGRVAWAACGSTAVRVQFYDYNPPDEDYWRAVSLHLRDEQHWWLLVHWPQPGGDTIQVWVDRNRDGVPDRYETFRSWNAFVARYGETLCDSLRVVLGESI